MLKRCNYFRLISTFALKLVFMAGLYIHIPFCKSRCVYCGFYSTTYETLKDKYVEALKCELSFTANANNIPQYPYSTLYIGGGTPSQLSIAQLATLLEDIKTLPDVERTIECNPDDITSDFAQGLKQLGFNRVSLGVQSFNDKQLKFLRRRHNAVKVREAINMLKSAGFQNISIDLMYGLPSQTLTDWESDIDEALALDVQHISCYCLTYEEDTPLYNMLARGEVAEADDELALLMYETLIDRLASAGFAHYEISNFAKPGYQSKHNSSYWNGTPYVGIGAGAHSYDGSSRSWNICDVKRYIKILTAPDCQPSSLSTICEKEELTADDRYNELVMTRLRTSAGLPIDEIPETYMQHFNKCSKPYIDSGDLSVSDNVCRITRKGLFISDAIISSLFVV